MSSRVDFLHYQQPQRRYILKASHCLLTTAEVKAIAATWLASVYFRRVWAYTKIPPGPLFDVRFFAMRDVVRSQQLCTSA